MVMRKFKARVLLGLIAYFEIIFGSIIACGI